MNHFYKWTIESRPIYGLGKFDTTGTWQSVTGPLVMCKNGFHVCRRQDLPFLCGTCLWQVETRGEELEEELIENDLDDNKLCFREIRFLRQLKWNREDMLEFFRWCMSRIPVNISCANSNIRAAAYADLATAREISAACKADLAINRGGSLLFLHRAYRAEAQAVRSAAALLACYRNAIIERREQLEWIENRIGETLS